MLEKLKLWYWRRYKPSKYLYHVGEKVDGAIRYGMQCENPEGWSISKGAYMAVWAESLTEIQQIIDGISDGAYVGCEKASKENCFNCKNFASCVYDLIEKTTPDKYVNVSGCHAENIKRKLD